MRRGRHRAIRLTVEEEDGELTLPSIDASGKRRTFKEKA